MDVSQPVQSSWSAWQWCAAALMSGLCAWVILKLGEKIKGGGGSLIAAKVAGQTKPPAGGPIVDYSDLDAKPPLGANSDEMIAEVARRASEPPMPVSEEKLFGLAFAKVPEPKPVPPKVLDQYGLKDKFHLE